MAQRLLTRERIRRARAPGRGHPPRLRPFRPQPRPARPRPPAPRGRQAVVRHRRTSAGTSCSANRPPNAPPRPWRLCSSGGLKLRVGPAGEVGVKRRSSPGPPHLDRPAPAVQHQGQFAALELQGVLAEGFAAPALQGGGVGLVVVGDLLQVGDRGDQLRGDAGVLGPRLQQHLEQLDNGPGGGGSAAFSALHLRRVGLAVAQRLTTMATRSGRTASRKSPWAPSAGGSGRRRRWAPGWRPRRSPRPSGCGPRGWSRCWAVRSRQAATAWNTARYLAVCLRGFSRFQAFSGSTS